MSHGNLTVRDSQLQMVAVLDAISLNMVDLDTSW